MRNRRAIIWLLLAIFAIVGVHFVSDCSGVATQPLSSRTALLPEADRAISLTVSRAGFADFRLAREAGTWRLVHPYGAPSDVARVNRLADALAFSPVQDALTDRELLRLGRTRSDFALVRPRVRIEVTDADGRHRELRLGSLTPGGDGVYAAVDDVDAVFVVGTNVLAAADLPADAFRSRRLVSATVDDVTAFDIRQGVGSILHFVRTGDSWSIARPNAVQASQATVARFLESIVGAEVQSFVWPVGATNETAIASVAFLAGYGLDSESNVSVTLKFRNGTESGLAFGRATDGGSVYALAPSGATIVTLPAALKDAVSANPASFLDTRLFALEPSQVSAVSLEDGGTLYLLSCGASGAWRLDAPVSAPADPEAVESLVGRLLALRSRDLDEQGVLVGLSTNAAPVAVSRSAVLGEMRLEELRAKEILKIDASHVKRIVVAKKCDAKDSSAETVAVLFDPDRRVWNVDAQVGRAGIVDEGAVASFLSAIASLKTDEVVSLKVTAAELSSYGLEDPAWTVSIDRLQEDSVRRTLLIGAPVRNGRYATVGSSDAVFVLGEADVASLTADLVIGEGLMSRER